MTVVPVWDVDMASLEAAKDWLDDVVEGEWESAWART